MTRSIYCFNTSMENIKICRIKFLMTNCISLFSPFEPFHHIQTNGFYKNTIIVLIIKIRKNKIKWFTETYLHFFKKELAGELQCKIYAMIPPGPPNLYDLLKVRPPPNTPSFCHHPHLPWSSSHTSRYAQWSILTLLNLGGFRARGISIYTQGAQRRHFYGTGGSTATPYLAQMFPQY